MISYMSNPLNLHLFNLQQHNLKTPLNLLLPLSLTWNLRRLIIIVSIGFLVHSMIVYMIFIMSIRVPKDYRQYLRKNVVLMILKLKDSPPPSINSWWLIVNQSIINFMKFKFIPDTFNRKKINSLMITRCLVLLTNSLFPSQPLLETSITSKVI